MTKPIRKVTIQWLYHRSSARAKEACADKSTADSLEAVYFVTAFSYIYNTGPNRH